MAKWLRMKIDDLLFVMKAPLIVCVTPKGRTRVMWVKDGKFKQLWPR